MDIVVSIIKKTAFNLLSIIIYFIMVV